MSDGTNMANLALLGQYTAASFVMATNGSGGTLIHNPPATLTQTLTQPSMHEYCSRWKPREEGKALAELSGVETQ